MLRFPISYIVNNGLIAYLDAGLKGSYSGSGSTWRNLAITGADSTLTSATFVNSVGGNFLFSTGYSSAGTTALLKPNTSLTLSLWMRANAYDSFNGIGGNTIFGFARGYVFDTDASGIYFRVGSGSWATASIARNATGVWANYVGTWDGTTVKIYKDSVIGTNASTSIIDYTSTSFDIGRYGTSSSNKIDGNFAQVLLYNRALTQAEITKNFQIMRKRFGV